MLECFITSKAKRNLLKLFLTNPERAFYLRELARLTGEPLFAVQKEVKCFVESGLLRSYRQGNLKYFIISKEFPLYPEWKKIIYSTVGLGDYLRKELNDAESIELAFIYGSVANNEETVRSDIDLFVVGTIKDIELHETISTIEKDIGREINYTLMGEEEFNRKKQSSEPFIRRVLSEPKIVLKGNPNVN